MRRSATVTTISQIDLFISNNYDRGQCPPVEVRFLRCNITGSVAHDGNPVDDHVVTVWDKVHARFAIFLYL